MSDLPRIPDAIDNKRLASMRQVARLKEKADAAGAAFIGGFFDDNGQMFVMTNIEDPTTKMPPTERQMRLFLEHLRDKGQGT